ncbi:Sec-independent protein translocase subunit TatA [Georgenia sp. SUBG003]|uniref:Sec-independent protein translocase subunit TatA n=1 Tax=Georgenia sp. SUBG003 TaxID=1497974 RepID=UPI0005BD295F
MFRNGLQPSHIIILLLVIILIFGASKLPDIASNIGKSLKVFKKEVKELRDDDNDDRADTSSYTATGGQPPEGTRPQYPGSQNPTAAQEQPPAGGQSSQQSPRQP